MKNNYFFVITDDDGGVRGGLNPHSPEQERKSVLSWIVRTSDTFIKVVPIHITMADEATIVTLLGNGGDPVEYTVSGASASVVKGEVRELLDASTCQKVSGAGVPIAGIASSDMTSGETATTKLSCLTHAVINLKTGGSGTATLGSYVRSAGADNTVTVSTTLDNETGKSIGKSLETGGNAEQIDILMNL